MEQCGGTARLNLRSGTLAVKPMFCRLIKVDLEVLGWVRGKIRSLETHPGFRAIPLSYRGTFCLGQLLRQVPGEDTASSAEKQLLTNLLPLLASEDAAWLPEVWLFSDVPSLPAGPPLSPHKFTFAELFAGIGGFRVALEALGGQCVFSCEKDRFAREAYKANFHPSHRGDFGDIAEIDAESLPQVDLLTAGFPCQPFSMSGQRLGFADDSAGGRGLLFWEIIRIARATQPRALLLENVRGLLTFPGALDTITEELKAAGYGIARHTVIDALELLPQSRRRLFIVAFLEGHERTPFAWPHIKRLRRCVAEVLEPPEAVNPELVLDDQRLQKVRESNYFREHPEARLITVPESCRGAQTLMAGYKRGWHLYTQFVRCGGQEDGEAATFRFFTVREALRLQGFPESFVPCRNLGRAYVQIGNAVSPPVVAAVAGEILRSLGRTFVGEGCVARLLFEALPPERAAALREQLLRKD